MRTYIFKGPILATLKMIHRRGAKNEHIYILLCDLFGFFKTGQESSMDTEFRLMILIIIFQEQNENPLDFRRACMKYG